MALGDRGLNLGVERDSNPIHLRTRTVLVGYLLVLLAFSIVAVAKWSTLHPFPDVEVPTLVFFGGDAIKFNALSAFLIVFGGCLAPKSGTMVSHLARVLVDLVLHWGVLVPLGVMVLQVLLPVGLLIRWIFSRSTRGKNKRAKGGYSCVTTADTAMEEVVVDDGDSTAGGAPPSPTAVIQSLGRVRD